jgi:TM2 domain-containing membrane protein YozV
VDPADVALIPSRASRGGTLVAQLTGEMQMPMESGAVAPPPLTLNANQKYCHACASVLDVRAELCPKCGVRQTAARSESGRSKIAAGVFALLLGGFGAHKFYLGKAGQGILYLVFFWTFIPAFIALIEGILYLTMSDEKFAAKYG